MGLWDGPKYLYFCCSCGEDVPLPTPLNPERKGKADDLEETERGTADVSDQPGEGEERDGSTT